MLVDHGRETQMIRFECDRCGMSAQGPMTGVFERAWGDHMAIHPDPLEFRQYAWTVVQLFP